LQPFLPYLKGCAVIILIVQKAFFSHIFQEKPSILPFSRPQMLKMKVGKTMKNAHSEYLKIRVREYSIF